MKTKRNLSIVTLTFMLSAIPLVFSIGLVDVTNLVENLSLLEPTSATTTVFIEPDEIIKDHLLDPGYQINDTFQINVNVSDVTDLYTWNVRVTWNPDILNFTRIVSYGDLLNQTSSPYGTSRMVDLINANNETGYAVMAETILGDYSGVSGNGSLITIEFLIIGYGSTYLNLSVTESAPTMLLDSSGSNIPFTTVDGYFTNVATHNIAITNLTATPSSPSLGETIYINVTVENKGDYSDTFNVSTYYTLISDPLIGKQNVTDLLRSENTTLTFEWAPNIAGTYEILANTTEVSGDVDLTDNTLTIIISVEYSESSSVNAFYMTCLIFAMFGSVMVLAFRKNREMSLSDMPASVLKQNIHNSQPSHTTNMWQDHIRQQTI